jgi:hypothetical protein
MMCLRDRPWLLTRTSPFAPPLNRNQYLEFWASFQVQKVLTPVQFCADYQVVAVPAILLDGASHDDFGLSCGIAEIVNVHVPERNESRQTNLSAVSKKLMPQS